MSLYYSALSLAESGYEVFPVHSAENGTCSCREGQGCGKVAKHPRTRNGFKDATTDRSQIHDWWETWPDANVGLRTGNGLVVVDIDGPEGERQASELDLPETVEAETGRGRHLYYEGQAGRRIGLLPGIDISGDGGYVIAPPSVHASGTSYEWINSPDDTEIAPLPGSITQHLQSRSTRNTGPSGPIERRRIAEGERSKELFRYGCLLRSIGAHQQEIVAAIDARNLGCCEPPLAVNEIAKIAESAAKSPGIYLSDDAILRTGIRPPGLALYLAIRARADHQGVCIAGFETLALEANMGRSTAITWSRELEALGVVQIERPGPLKLNEGPKANIYTLLDPEEGSTAPALALGTTTGAQDDDGS